jgi:hypothetical protein
VFQGGKHPDTPSEASGVRLSSHLRSQIFDARVFDGSAYTND